MKRYELSEYIHPTDSLCHEKVLETKVIRDILNIATNEKLDEVFHYTYSASLIELDSEHVVHSYLRDGCRMFGLDQMPRIYLARSYYPDIQCVGYEKPLLVVPDSLLDAGDLKILRGRIMATAASIKAEHHKLSFITWLLDNFSSLFHAILDYAVRLPMNEWTRAQQYTRDRAFLLATEDYPLAQKNILFGEIPADILNNFQFGNAGTFDSQVEAFYEQDGAADALSKLNSFCQREIWIPAQYKQLQSFYLECGGKLWRK